MSAGKTWLAKSRVPFGLALLAVVIRIYLFLNIRVGLHTDSVTYLILSDLEKTRTPGYPLFIEAVQFLNDLFLFTTDYLRLLAFVQMFLLGVLNCLMIYFLAKRLTRSTLFALAAGVLYNFDYQVIGFEFSLLTETLSITLLLATLLFYLRLFDGKKYSGLGAGLCGGLLILTRPGFLLLAPALLGLTTLVHFRAVFKRGFYRPYVRGLAVFVLFNILAWGGWSLRNQIRFDYFGLSDILPYQFRHYTNTFFHKYKPSGDPLMDNLAAMYIEENCNAGLWNARVKTELNLPDAQVSKIFLKMNLKMIRDFPMDYIRQIPDSAFLYYGVYNTFWASPNERVLLNKKRFIPRIFRLFFDGYRFLFTRAAARIVMLILCPLLLLFLLRKEKAAFHLAVLCIGVTNYNFVVSVLTCIYGDNLRYRVPVEPLVLLVFLAALFIPGRFFLSRFNPYTRSSQRPG